MSLLGRWNWWLPVWIARLLRVEPSPLHASEPDDDPDASVEREPVGSGV